MKYTVEYSLRSAVKNKGKWSLIYGLPTARGTDLFMKECFNACPDNLYVDGLKDCPDTKRVLKVTFELKKV